MSLKNLKSIFSTKSTLDKNNKRSIHINTGGEHFKKHTKFDDGLTKLGLTPLKPSSTLNKLGLTPLKPSDKPDTFGPTKQKPSQAIDTFGPTKPKISATPNKLGLTEPKISAILDIFKNANIHIGDDGRHFKNHTLFDDDVRPFTEIYNQNQPIDRFDTKLNYNENSLISQTYGFDVNMETRGGRENPILDSSLRGRVYDPIRFSQNFTNDNLFVKPETSEVQEQLFRTQTFDPRSETPKQNTLYFNTGKTLGTLQYGQGGFFTQVSTLNNDFNNNSITDFSTSGFKGIPYTRLSDLGKSPLDGLTWEKLYNSNHTPKDSPTHQGISAVSYGPNVNRDKLDIRDNGTTPSIYNLSRRSLLTTKDSEPYIISDIPKKDDGLFENGRLLNQGPILGIPVNRMITDTVRIGKYLTSPAGIAFILKQNFLGANSKSVFRQFNTVSGTNISVKEELMSSRQRFKQTYNPASTLLQTLTRAGFGPVGLVDKTEPGLDSIFGSDEYGIESTSLKTAGGQAGFTNEFYSIHDTFTGGSNESNVTTLADFGGQLGKAILGTNGIPSTATKAFNASDRMTIAKMITGNTLDAIDDDNDPSTPNTTTGTKNANQSLGFDIEKTKEGMPFYFKDLRDSSYIFFRAYLDGITENISPSWSSTNYMGRSEPVYTYERAEREISMTLKLVAQTSEELVAIYKKMDRLTSLCYPEYDINDDYGNRMKPPLTLFRMGEMFGKKNDELMGFIKSVSYTVEQTSTWETDVGKRVPRHVTATLGYQVIHNKTPNLKTNFYGINYV